MRPRNLSAKLKINNEDLHTINCNSNLDSIPKFKKFKSLKIETYCPHCLSKHKLEYSGFLPTKIGYKCDKCENNNVIAEKTTDNVQNISTKYLASELKDHLKDVESFSCGYNHAISNRGYNELYKKLERGRLAEILIQFVPVLHILLATGFSAFVIQGNIPLSIMYQESTYIYLFGSFVLSISIMIIGICMIQNYTNLKDNVLNNTNRSWVMKGIQKAKKSEDLNEKEYSKNEETLTNKNLEYNK